MDATLTQRAARMQLAPPAPGARRPRLEPPTEKASVTEGEAEEKRPTPVAEPGPTKVRAKQVDVFYGEKQALFAIDLDIRPNVGNSGCRGWMRRQKLV